MEKRQAWLDGLQHVNPVVQLRTAEAIDAARRAGLDLSELSSTLQAWLSGTRAEARDATRALGVIVGVDNVTEWLGPLVQAANRREPDVRRGAFVALANAVRKLRPEAHAALFSGIVLPSVERGLQDPGTCPAAVCTAECAARRGFDVSPVADLLAELALHKDPSIHEPAILAILGAARQGVRLDDAREALEARLRLHPRDKDAAEALVLVRAKSEGWAAFEDLVRHTASTVRATARQVAMKRVARAMAKAHKRHDETLMARWQQRRKSLLSF